MEKFKFCSSRNFTKFPTPRLRLFRCREEESAIDPIVAFGVATLLLVEVISSTDLLPNDQLACRPVERSCRQLFSYEVLVRIDKTWIVYA